MRLLSLGDGLDLAILSCLFQLLSRDRLAFCIQQDY